MKSHAKLLLSMCGNIYKDIAAQCATNSVDLHRDLETIRSRCKYEGISFLTITLPNFCQGFERGLEQGRLTREDFQGWKFSKSLPCFLKGLTSLVFDVATGTILQEPCALSVKLIRQMTLSFKKIQIPCSPEKVEKALDGFVELECDLESYHDNPDGLDVFTKISELLWGSAFRDSNETELIPRHGPGATEERISGNQKYVHRIWHERLQPFFPYDEYACFNIEHAVQSKDTVSFPGLEKEKPVRVIPVPKTLKGPRIIAIEPVCMQYTQQALLRSLVQDLETHPKTSGYVNFTDQTVNQDLALKSSVDGSYATIDLKDASDRVSSGLVWHMLESYPDLRDAVFACRSTKASVPNRDLMVLGRFASMGSALCFPIEAMVFYTAVLAGMARHDGVQMTKRRLDGYLGRVFVYGDDLIVPVEYVHTVMDELEGLNLRVNRDKSFLSGKFRESCGVDAYDGEDVTPVYLRSMPPKSRQQVEELESWVSVANQFYEIGYWRASAFVRAYINRIHTLPIVRRDCSLLGWHSYTHVQEVHRWNRGLQTWETRSLKRWSPKEPSALADMPALMKCLLVDNRDYLIGSITKPLFEDPEHLQYAGRPRNAYTKTGWALF